MMTVWLIRNIDDEDERALNEDLSAIFHAQDLLNETCEKLNITPICEFFDESEILAEFDEFDGEDLEESWHEASDLLNTINGLEQYFTQNPKDFANETFTMDDLLAEFVIMKPVLQLAIDNNEQVHLAVLS